MANDDPAMTPAAAVARHLEWLEFALAAARDEETRRRERLAKASGKNRDKRTVRLSEVSAEVRELAALVDGLKGLQARPATSNAPAPRRGLRRSASTRAKPASRRRAAPATSAASAAATASPATAAAPSAAAAKPATKRAAKPASTRARKPATRRAAKPSTTQAAKPSTTQAAKPSTTQAAKPATSRAAKPSTTRAAKPKSTSAKPATRRRRTSRPPGASS